MAEVKKTKEQEEFETRMRLFNKEFEALQTKYMFKVVAQHVWPAAPGNHPAVTTIPLTLIPIIIEQEKEKGMIVEKSDLEDPTK